MRNPYTCTLGSTGLPDRIQFAQTSMRALWWWSIVHSKHQLGRCLGMRDLPFHIEAEHRRSTRGYWTARTTRPGGIRWKMYLIRVEYWRKMERESAFAICQERCEPRLIGSPSRDHSMVDGSAVDTIGAIRSICATKRAHLISGFSLVGRGHPKIFDRLS